MEPSALSIAAENFREHGALGKTIDASASNLPRKAATEENRGRKVRSKTGKTLLVASRPQGRHQPMR